MEETMRMRILPLAVLAMLALPSLLACGEKEDTADTSAETDTDA